MLCETREDQILWQRRNSTRPKQSLAIETNVTPNHMTRTSLAWQITNSGALTAPLRELLKGNYQFHWSPTHQEAHEKVKVSYNNELTYFDPEKEIILQVDTSLKGLGVTLIQENKPVVTASKSLTDV